MENLEKIISDLFKYKQIKHNPSLLDELVALTCMKMYNEYMLMPTSNKNVELTKKLQLVYPNSNIIVSNNYDSKTAIINLHSFLLKSIKKSNKTEDVVDEIKKKVIILKKNEELKEYLETLKVGSLLAENKKSVFKQISIFKRSYCIFGYHGGLSHFLSKKDKQLKSSKIKMARIVPSKSNKTLSLHLEKTINLNRKIFNSANTNLVDETKKLKNTIKKDVLLSIDNHQAFKNYRKVMFNNMYVSLQDVFMDNKVRNDIARKNNITVYNISHAENKAYGSITLTDIDFDDFYHYVHNVVDEVYGLKSQKKI